MRGNDVRRVDGQFAETQGERNERLAAKRDARRIETLINLIEDLADSLIDGGGYWTPGDLASLRRRTANALTTDRCPDWLVQYLDPPVVAS